ncbi:MAG: radical SAM protein [Acidobacteriota bacterium]
MAGLGARGENGRSSLPIIGSTADAAQAKKDLERKFRPDIYWYLSFRCNLACKHCSVFSSPFVDTSDDLTTADCIEVVDQMKELNVRCAILSGGEVLFRPDALEILEALLDREISIGLETNGLLFTDKIIEFAQRAGKKGLFNTCISIDGGTAETHDQVRGPNTFGKIIANLNRLKDAGVEFDVQCVLNRNNLPTVPNLIEEARKLRPALQKVQFGFLNPVGRGTEYIKEVGLQKGDMSRILKLIKGEQPDFDGTIVVKAPPGVIPPQYLSLVYGQENVLGCRTCQFPLLGVLPNGDITICALSRDNDSIYYGNTKKERLKDIWIKTRMDYLRSTYVAADTLTGICGDCIWQKTCKGSCRAWAYEQGGSFDAPFPLCARLDEEGEFPDAYRLSKQQQALDGISTTGLLAAGGCTGCG